MLQYARVVIDVRIEFLQLSQILHDFLSIKNIESSPSLSLQCATAEPDGRKRALVIGGGIANFTDVAATFSGIIRALKEKVPKPHSFFKMTTNYSSKARSLIRSTSYQESKLKAARMNLYVRRGGPNYQKGLEKMRTLAEDIGIPIEV